MRNKKHNDTYITSHEHGSSKGIPSDILAESVVIVTSDQPWMGVLDAVQRRSLSMAP